MSAGALPRRCFIGFECFINACGLCLASDEALCGDVGSRRTSKLLEEMEMETVDHYISLRKGTTRVGTFGGSVGSSSHLDKNHLFPHLSHRSSRSSSSDSDFTSATFEVVVLAGFFGSSFTPSSSHELSESN